MTSFLSVLESPVDYKAEKGLLLTRLAYTELTVRLVDVIEGFLKNYKSTEKDLATGFANIDIDDEAQANQTETASLKYMQQLVRVKGTLFTRWTRF
jgi:hypothetical protein